MQTISRAFFSLAVVCGISGMMWGMHMGASQDFATAPAHAHLNLVGGVLLFLFGLYYRLVPDAGASTLAKWQGWLHIIGGILMPAGVAVVITYGNGFIAVPILGSLVMLAAMALFAVIVFRTAQA